MNKSKLAIALFALTLPFLGASVLTGCVSAVHEESTGQYIDSSAITMKVKSKLLADDSVKSLSISVVTYKGVVQLSGFVDSPSQKQRAIEIARQIEGVKGVVDALVIKNQ